MNGSGIGKSHFIHQGLSYSPAEYSSAFPLLQSQENLPLIQKPHEPERQQQARH